MTWDHPVHSFSLPNGEPQTPTRTPTTSFGDTSFQTPKFESSFFDPRVTWDTSDPYASSPEFLRTPQRFSLYGSSTLLRIPDTVPERNATPLSGNGGLGARTEADPSKQTRQGKPNGPGGDEESKHVHSAKSAASMQTPPPSSASRRNATEDDRTIRTRNFATPSGNLETPSRLLGASPRMLANLQSSPDLFQLASMGQSASPYFPQHKLFWEETGEQQRSTNGLPSGSDVPPSKIFNSSHTAWTELEIPQLRTMEGSMELPQLGGSAFNLLSTGPNDAALFPAPFSTSPRLPAAKAEDPALFLSSPARRFGGLPPTPQKDIFSGPRRQPYHHQAEESKRDEMQQTQQSGRRHVTSLISEGFKYDEDDEHTPRQVRPGLTRSLTHTAVTSTSDRSSLSQSSYSGTMAAASGVRKSPTKGRSSPVKSVRQSLPRFNSTAALPSRSESVVLKIDKDGRAKTEMQVVNQGATGLTDPISSMELEVSSPLTDSDTAEYSEYPISHSQRSSFILPEPGISTLTLAQNESGSRPQSKGSYASTGSSGRVSLWPSFGEWKTPQRHSMVVSSNFTYGNVSRTASSTAADLDEDRGDAQHALKKVLKGRGRNLTVGYDARPTSRSSRPSTHIRSSPPPRFGGGLPSSSRSSPAAMADPDFVASGTDRLKDPGNCTRCVCKSMENGGHLMIQCESCGYWLHTKCVGLERANLPSVYVCIFCTQPAPVHRDPVSAAGHAPSSPLAHKSLRSR